MVCGEVRAAWVGRGPAALAGLILAGLVPGAVRAAAPPLAPPDAGPTEAEDVHLSWVAPATDCPGSDALMEELTAYRVGQTRRVAPAVVHVKATRIEATGWAADVRIEVDGDVVRRRFTAESCAVLASGVALLVAVAVDPGATADAVEPRREPIEPAAPTPEAAAGDTAAATAAAQARPRTAALLRIGAGGNVGVLPALGPTVGGAAGMQIGQVGWLVHGRFLPAREALVRGAGARAAAGAGAELAAWMVGGQVCYRFSPSRARMLELPLCAGGAIGEIFGRGRGLETNRAVRSVWGELGGSASLVLVALPWLAFYVEPEGFVALNRISFVIDDYGELFRSAAGGARLNIGVELRFPHDRRDNRGARRPRQEQ